MLHHGFEQSNALTPDKQASSRTQGEQSVEVPRRAVRHFLLQATAPLYGLPSAAPESAGGFVHYACTMNIIPQFGMTQTGLMTRVPANFACA
jgi:hypothetical protein